MISYWWFNILYFSYLSKKFSTTLTNLLCILFSFSPLPSYFLFKSLTGFLSSIKDQSIPSFFIHFPTYTLDWSFSTWRCESLLFPGIVSFSSSMTHCIIPLHCAFRYTMKKKKNLYTFSYFKIPVGTVARVFREAAFVTCSLLFVAFAFAFPLLLRFPLTFYSLFHLLEYYYLLLFPWVWVYILGILGRGVDILGWKARGDNLVRKARGDNL